MNFNLPFAIDHANKDKPSVTLLFAYASFVLAVASIIALHFCNCPSATFSAISLHVISLTIYRMRKIDKLKVGKEGIELEGDSKTS